MQRPRIVPVVEVAPVLFQPVERVERVLEPFDQVAQADVAQVVGGQGREQQQALVGRRGAMGNAAVGDLLEVVRREPVVFFADESLEEVPGLAAIRRSARRSWSLSGDWATRLGWLTRKATAGDTNQATRNGLPPAAQPVVT